MAAKKYSAKHMRNHRPESRAIQRLVKMLDVILVTSVFAVCWYMFYGTIILTPFYNKGNWVVIILFLLLYYNFSHLYSGFRIHLNKISELIYAQTLAVLLTNLFCYIVICLLYQGFPNIIPMLISICAETLLVVLWCYSAHQWYFRTFSPNRTAVVFEEREGLEDLVEAYGMEKHFNIVRSVCAKECMINQFVELQDVEVVFLFGVVSHDRNKFLKYCIENGIDVYVIPRIGDVLMSGAHSMHLFHLPMLMLERYNPTPEFLLVKRMLDVVISFITLIVLSPVFLVISVIIKCTDGGPVFYKQTRLTINGKKFKLIKFRSMRVDAEKDGIARLSTGENDPRITPVGRFIRKCRIDEFPQLINIIKGEMSIVGPRPERPEIATQYEETMPEFKLRLQAKAGLTGYAQVYGKYNTTPYDKLLMDLMYIAKPSLVEDFKIVFATIKILFLKDSTEGVSEEQKTALK